MEILESKKWYKNLTNNKVFFYSGLNNDNFYIGYGFDENGIYQDEIKLHKQNEYTEEFSIEELELLFTSEATRRGFVNGVKYKSASRAKNAFLAEGKMRFDGVCLRFNQGLLFYKGRWGVVLNEEEPKNDTKVIFCTCHNKEHQLVFTKDEEYNLVYAEMHLTKLWFWKRLLLGVKYIFGYQSRYGAFDEIIFDKNHAADFIAIGEFLKDKSCDKVWV